MPAHKIKIDDIDMDVSGEFSHKDFSNRIGLTIPDNAVIYGSCFAQQDLDTIVFNPGMKGVQFFNCNLDNVVIPPGNPINKASGCSRRRIKVMNDLRDWELNAQGNPLKVVNEKHWINQGLSVDPLDIPAQKLNDISEIKKAVV